MTIQPQLEPPWSPQSWSNICVSGTIVITSPRFSIST
jgi:hypothetical protein